MKKIIILMLLFFANTFAFRCEVKTDDDIAKVIYMKKPHFINEPPVDTYVTLTKDRKILIIEWPCPDNAYGIICHKILDANTGTSFTEDIFKGQLMRDEGKIKPNEPFEMWIRNIRDCKF